MTPAAVAMVEKSVDDWNRAIHARFDPAPFHLVIITEGKADITIRPKGGGGGIQGTAMCSDNGKGFFTDCKLNVSGKAFGSTNSSDAVLSISLQELGHALGMLHSDNTADVMYGTLQSPANTVISVCDMEAWEEVMHWLVGTDAADPPVPHRPHVTSVSCGTAPPPAPPPPGGLTGDLDLAVTIGHSPGEDGPFVNKDRVHILITVIQNGAAVEGATGRVTLVTPKPNSDLAGGFTTDANGVGHTHYKVNKGRDGTGTYHTLAEASKDAASGECREADACHADFTVN